MRKLIFDLGMNNGDDTDYYLAKNYDVVAVEANPYLCETAKERFGDAITQGRLSVLNYAIADGVEDCTFYINQDNSHWSSLDLNWATRDGTTAVPCAVKGTTLAKIMEIYGCPYFIKIDIEGGDRIVIQQLMESRLTPSFLSIEDCRFGFEYLEWLKNIGYRRFKLSNQTVVSRMEDASIGYRFNFGSSGMFGDELAGDWLAYDDFLQRYEQTVRNSETKLKISPPDVWWDIHCGF